MPRPTLLADVPRGSLVRTSTGIRFLVGRKRRPQDGDPAGRHIRYLKQKVRDKSGRVWYYPEVDSWLPNDTPVTILRPPRKDAT